MTAWLAVRLAKLAAAALVAAGGGAALAHPARAGRLRLAYGVVVPAFLATWLLGYGLLQFTHRGVGEPWVVGAMGASIAGLHAVLHAAHRTDAGRGPAVVAAAGALATVAAMVMRPMTPAGLAAALGGGAAAGGLLAVLPWRAVPAAAGPRDDADAAAFVDAVGRAEGATFVVLVIVAIGRRVPGVVVPHEVVGWLGWTHGALVLVYLQGLVAAGRALGWPARVLGAGVVAALIPLGPLGFERWRRRP